MTQLVQIFAASFAYVFLRAFQQLNVMHNARSWVMVTSYLMAIGDVFLVTRYAQAGFHLGVVLSVGTGAGLGCLAAMNARRYLVDAPKK